MSRINIVRISMVKEKSINYATNTVTSPDTAFDILTEFINTCCCNDRENLIVMCLNSKNKVVALNLASIGTLNSAMAHPREIFKAAILSNANSIIIAHNHPSGDPAPSKEDVSFTKRLMAAGEIIGITVLDSIVIGDGHYISIKDKDLRSA